MANSKTALGAFYLEMLGRTDWRVFSTVKTKDPAKLPLVLTRDLDAALRNADRLR